MTRTASTVSVSPLTLALICGLSAASVFYQLAPDPPSVQSPLQAPRRARKFRAESYGLLTGEALLSAIRKGGLNVFLQGLPPAGETPPSGGDDPCPTETYLAPADLRLAGHVHRVLGSLGLTASSVVVSDRCDDRELAALLFPDSPTSVEPKLTPPPVRFGANEVTAYLDRALREARRPGELRVLIGDSRAGLEARPGEALFFRPLAGGGCEALGGIRFAEWLTSEDDPAVLGWHHEQDYLYSKAAHKARKAAKVAAAGKDRL